MPLYEYECPRTGKRFEVIQKFSDDPITKCENCDQYADCEGECRKILSAPAIQFKGTGWYVTDYAGKSGDRKESKSTDQGSSAGSDTGSKSDSSGSSDTGGKSEKKESSTPKKESSGSKSDS